MHRRNLVKWARKRLFRKKRSEDGSKRKTKKDVIKEIQKNENRDKYNTIHREDQRMKAWRGYYNRHEDFYDVHDYVNDTKRNDKENYTIANYILGYGKSIQICASLFKCRKLYKAFCIMRRRFLHRQRIRRKLLTYFFIPDLTNIILTYT